jgi:hypothetical protein
MDLRAFIAQAVTSAQNRTKLLNYGDQDQGLRSPSSPSGLLVQSDGTNQLYSGKSKLITSLLGLILAVTDVFRVRATRIELEPEDIGGLVIAGRTINREVFEGRKVVLASESESPFEELEVLTPGSRAMADGTIVNTKSLSSVLTEASLFERSFTVTPKDIAQSRAISKALGSKGLPGDQAGEV